MFKRSITYSFILFSIFFLLTPTTHAANKYWVGGTASWDGTAGSKWSLTSGGASGATLPTSVDNCFFNASSTGTVTIATGNTGCNNVDFTGFTGTVAGTGALTISGSLTLGASSTRTYTGTLTFNATTSTSTITSNGISLDSPITFNGVNGVYQLGDDLTTGSSRTVTLTNGTLDANNHNITMGLFSSTNSNIRTLTMGSGTWTITGSSTTVWTTAISTGLTLNRGNDVVLNSTSTTGTRTVTAGTTGGSATTSIGFKVTGGSDTLTITTSSSQRVYNLIFDGFTGTFTNGVRNIYGDFIITSTSSGMTVATGTNTTTFAATSGTKTITTSGKTIDFPITFDGVGGTWQLGDDLTMGNTRTLTLTSGTFDANGKNISIGIFSSESISDRTLKMGNGQWTITGNNSTIWSVSRSYTLNLIRGINPIFFSYSGSSGTRTLNFGELEANNAPSIVISAGTDTVLIVGGINSLDFTGFEGIFNNRGTRVYSDVVFSGKMSVLKTESFFGIGGAMMSNNINFSAGVSANGKMYGIPRSANSILIYDTLSDTAEYSNMGANLNTLNKWQGGLLGNDGKIYGMPYDSSEILIIDPVTNTATTSSMGLTLAGSSKWGMGVLAANGKIYAVPIDSNSILIIDTNLGAATTSTMGADLSGTGKWSGGVLGQDGKIYGIPLNSTNILIIDPIAGTATTSTMGADLSGTNKWYFGSLASNGKIYSAPFNSTSTLIIDTMLAVATTSTLGADLTGSSQYYGTTLAQNGKIYATPFNSNKILIIDPISNVASMTSMGADLSGSSKWYRGDVAPNGKIYSISRGLPQTLIIDPSTNTAYRSTMGLSQTTGTRTLTTNGQILNFPLSIEGEGGTFNLADDLVMGSSSSLYIGGGTFNTNNHNITTGSINMSGIDPRTINLGSSIITLTGTSTPVWGNTLTTNQTFNPQTSTVVLDGNNQSIEGSTSFYNLTKRSTITDTLTFDANSTQTILGTLTLQGMVDNILSLVSSISGTKWNINPISRSLSYLNVSDSNNTNSTPISAYSMTSITDSGNNTNWQFTTPTTSTIHSSSGGTSGYRRYTPPSVVSTTTPVLTTTAYTFTRDLTAGITGTDVKKLQQFLNSKGYNVTKTGEETTYFGLKTQQALIRFQKDNNITPAIGYFGPITRTLINKLLNTTIVPTTTITPTPSTTSIFTRDLTLGSKGDDVTRLQTILNTQGYLTVSPTGYFGNLTLQAVKEYQKANNITPVTGYFGPVTRGRLNR